jgi:hypothetical protein
MWAQNKAAVVRGFVPTPRRSQRGMFRHYFFYFLTLCPGLEQAAHTPPGHHRPLPLPIRESPPSYESACPRNNIKGDSKGNNKQLLLSSAGSLSVGISRPEVDDMRSTRVNNASA